MAANAPSLERRPRSAEVALSAVGIFLGVLSYVPVLFKLETPAEHVTAILAALTIVLVFLRSVHLWAQHRLDRTLAALVLVMVITMTVPLFVIGSRTAQGNAATGGGAAPGSGSSGSPAQVQNVATGTPGRPVVSASPSRSSATVPLSSITPAASNLDTATVTVDTRTHDDALMIEKCRTDGADAMYLINRQYARFTAVAGVTDESTFPDQVSFAVLGDGVALASKKASLGKPVTFNVDVSNVVQLRLIASVEFNVYSDKCQPAWADARLERKG